MQMRSDYLTYGQSMSFDVTYNLIKERSNGRQYGVGIFGGKNSFNHVVIFGIALLLNENTESMCCLFKNFIEVMGQPPETILSD